MTYIELILYNYPTIAFNHVMDSWLFLSVLPFAAQLETEQGTISDGFSEVDEHLLLIYHNHRNYGFFVYAQLITWYSW